MSREVELLTQGNTARWSWCWVLGLLLVNLVRSVANRKMSGLRIGTSHPVTNIHGELALFQTPISRGPRLGAVSSPVRHLAMSGHISVVYLFYLNLKFSKIIQTKYERGRKIRIRHHSDPGTGMAGGTVRTVQ